MKSWILSLITCIFTFGFMGCQTGHCRRDGRTVHRKEDVQPPSGYQRASSSSVMVAKADGSLQCGMKAGSPVSDMVKDLNGIQIISSMKQHDGLNRIQTCGMDTGMINLYEIDAQDLSKAQKLGFSLFQKDN